MLQDAGRSGVDHVARISNSGSDANEGGAESAVTQNLNAKHSAIKMVANRLHIIKAYVQG